MRIYTIVFTAILAMFGSGIASAQTPGMDVYMVDMSGALGYVLVFYAFTFISLGLLLFKLVRPKFPTYWLYICCIIGILGAGIVTWAFEEIRAEQLPSVANSDIKPEELSPVMQEELAMRTREIKNQRFANFWIIGIPNFIILGLGIFIDLNNRNRDPNKPRSRYD